MTQDDRDALDALLSDPSRLFPEERLAITNLMGRVLRLDPPPTPWTCGDCGKECPGGSGWCTCDAVGLPVLPRVRP